MRTFILLITICASIISCNTKSEAEEQKTKKQNDLDYSKFTIGKKHIGNIKIGMTLKETSEFTDKLKEVQTEAYKYGFGGGSSAYEYYYNDELLFAILPKLYSDTILFLIGISSNLKTENGLNPKSSIVEMSEVYNNVWVHQDLMSGGENFYDTINNWTFHFETDKKNQLGTYPEYDKPSLVSNQNGNSTWVVVR